MPNQHEERIQRAITRAQSQIADIDKSIDSIKAVVTLLYSMRTDTELVNLVRITTEHGELQMLLGNLELIKAYLQSVITAWEAVLIPEGGEE